MFPPKKTGPSGPQKPAPKSPAPGGPPPGDLLSMLGGGPPAPSMPGMPPGFGGTPSGPGMPRPGKGMDPMSAMLGGLVGPPQTQSPSGVAGGDGLPIGATAPQPGRPDQMGGSSLLSMLSGGDPYDQPPGATPLADAGGSQPGGEMASLLQLLALAGMGVDPQDAGIQGPSPGGLPGL